jgi:hypothetical protein
LGSHDPILALGQESHAFGVDDAKFYIGIALVTLFQIACFPLMLLSKHKRPQSGLLLLSAEVHKRKTYQPGG